MLWTSYYPAIQVNSVQCEHPPPCCANSEGLWATQEGSSSPRNTGSCQVQWGWCWCCCVRWVLFLFIRFIFITLQDQHFFKTQFSFAIKLNYLFWVINKKICYEKTLWFTDTGERKRMLQSFGVFFGMDVKDCWEGENKKTMTRIWTTNLILEENSAELPVWQLS